MNVEVYKENVDDSMNPDKLELNAEDYYPVKKDSKYLS